jgi:hypothetical protein
MSKPKELSNKQKAAENTEADVSAPRVELDNDPDVADTVNRWISESRENRRAERIFSDEQIAAWRFIPFSLNP